MRITGGSGDQLFKCEFASRFGREHRSLGRHLATLISCFLGTDLESRAGASWLLGNRCGRTARAIVDSETHLGASRRQRQGRHLGEVFPALHIQK